MNLRMAILAGQKRNTCFSLSLSLCMYAHVCICNDPAHPHICMQALTVHLSVVATAPWRLLFSPWWGDAGDVLGMSCQECECWRAGSFLSGVLPLENQSSVPKSRRENGDGAFSRRLVRGSTRVCWAKSSSLIKSAHHLKRGTPTINKKK